MQNWVKPLRAAVLLALVAAAIALPFYWGDTSLLTTLVQALLLATLAASWNILAGFAGQINLGHAASFGIGALTTRQLWLELGWGFWPSFVLGGVAAAAAALLIGIPALRLRGIYFSIATLAIAQALRATISSVLPKVTRLPGPVLAEYQISERYFVALAVLLGTLVTAFVLKRSKLGLGMQTVREDELAAESIGVNSVLHKLSAFVISAFWAGLAGSAFAFYHPSFYYSLAFEPSWTFDALLITFIGGIGTLGGPVLGTLFFVFVRDVLAATWVDFHLILFGLLFILVVLLMPGGFVEFWQTAKGRLRNVLRMKL
ncbi:MAG TPA: branched-chain amino acid ABC transporter permease [Anaerolineales bacterium]|nr:branched-chain amino acid ABC transporter permease [Anaerolineales bacterium]HRQ91783.1 branched-chain amino acid ABC transporter permease [Anaerolineales bacterium]